MLVKLIQIVGLCWKLYKGKLNRDLVIVDRCMNCCMTRLLLLESSKLLCMLIEVVM